MKVKTKIILAILITMVFLTNCKNNKSIDSLELVTPKLINNSFIVKLNVVVKNDDTFGLYYTIDGTTNFGSKEPIWKAVKGEPYEQLLTFTFPPNIYPTQLRLDFGLEKDQEIILLKSVILEYKENKREIIGDELGNFFHADNSKCTFDPNTGEIIAIEKDGIKQIPSLYPHESMLELEIEKLAKKQ